MTVICLDLDGTLEDSRDDMVAAVQRVRRRLKLPPRVDEDFRPHVNRGMAHLYRACFAEALEGRDAESAAEALSAVRLAYTEEYGARIAETTRLYDGMAGALDALADMAPLALVTNKPEGLSLKLLAALGVADRFAAVIGGDTLAVAKPDPAVLDAALARTGGAPAVMIGDSAGDIRCAKSHGTPVIWCAWGYADAPGPLEPDAVARHPSELPEKVTALLGWEAPPEPETSPEPGV